MQRQYAVVLIASVAVAIVSILLLSRGLPTGIMVESEEPKVGLGISHYDLSNVTVNGESRLVAARVTNTGTLDLKITIGWTQKNSPTLNISVEPESVQLKPEESVKVYLTVRSPQPGVYEGSVEIQGSRTSEEGGNQVVSGGSINVCITAT